MNYTDYHVVSLTWVQPADTVQVLQHRPDGEPYHFCLVDSTREGFTLSQIMQLATRHNASCSRIARV